MPAPKSGDAAPAPEERRRYRRYQIPALVEAPAFSEEALMPEDISAGGFQLIVSDALAVGSVVSCALIAGQKRLGPYPTEIVWVRENEMDLSTRAIGLHMRMDDEERGRLDAILGEIAGQGG